MSVKALKLKGGTRLHQAAAYDRPEGPLVSVITAVFNGGGTIRGCIESVLSQDYPHIEHIVIDGGSTDGTIDVLREYENRIALWRSEPDHGVYDAWNKGLQMAHGEWIAFLGADDTFLPGAVRAYMELARQNFDAELLSSVVRREYTGGYTRLVGERWQWPRFLKFMCTAHPGSMHKTSLFKKYGFYDTSYKIVADYELLLRAKSELKAAFMSTTTVAMKAGGVSDSFRALLEASRATVETGGRPPKRAALELCIAVLKRIAHKTLLGVRTKRLA
jgi:glycosyltransferase involved in cell wall biosynthesis